jgi:3',5'-cyclic AMP phosphodiesterase CpdA
MARERQLLAVSDLHVGYAENRAVLEHLRPGTDEDWLIVAGDVAEKVDDIAWALDVLRSRFAKVLWTPGNHELWTHPEDRVRLRGQERYDHLIATCRAMGVHTPEDEFLRWESNDGQSVIIALLCLLYDYTFLPDEAPTREAAMALARRTGVICTDEFLLHSDPFPDIAAWCQDRVRKATQRLEASPAEDPLILVNHWPLHRHPTRVLYYPEFQQWCGTTQTSDWHLRFNTAAVVYGHLHIPRTTYQDGIRFEEVSLGYPREWQRRGSNPSPVRRLLPH